MIAHGCENSVAVEKLSVVTGASTVEAALSCYFLVMKHHGFEEALGWSYPGQIPFQATQLSSALLHSMCSGLVLSHYSVLCHHDGNHNKIPISLAV